MDIKADLIAAIESKRRNTKASMVLCKQLYQDREHDKGIDTAIDLINTLIPSDSVLVPMEINEEIIDSMMGAFGEVQIFGIQPPSTRETVIAQYKAIVAMLTEATKGSDNNE